VAAAGLDKAVIYDEELAIIAPARHAPIRSPRDVAPGGILAFEAGCPYRLRLEQWFAQSGAIPERIVEMTSWHAILGCTVAGMGVSLLPKMVLAGYPQRIFLSVHPLPPHLAKAPTVLIWRKGTHAPKVAALREVLVAHAAGEQAPEAAEPARKRAAKPAARRPNGSKKAA
jgi:DNA-binding transcriptional LysR family regulator